MTPPNLPEKLVLAFLICLSVAGFSYRFRGVVHVISAVKPDPGFRLEDLGPRLRTFAWEVLLQGKVIQQRPAAGLAHAFVFWGFCAFAPITVNHIATAFGARFLYPNSGFGEYYYTFV